MKIPCFCFQPSPDSLLQQDYVGPEALVIPQLNVVQYPEMKMSSDTSFHARIGGMVATWRRKAGCILRTFRTKDKEALLNLRRTFLLRHLENCSELWSDHGVGLIVELDAPQLYFTKKNRSVKGLSHWVTLEDQQFYYLQQEPDWNVMIYVWNSQRCWHQILASLAILALKSTGIELYQISHTPQQI